MAAVVLEHTVESGNGNPYKAQVLDDGSYGVWSDVAYNIQPDGSSTFDPQEYEWRLQARLNEDRMQRLKDAITDSGFFNLDATYQPESGIKDGSKVTWYAQVDGKTHKVEVTGSVSVPELDKLKEAMGTITQEALDEAHDA